MKENKVVSKNRIFNFGDESALLNEENLLAIRRHPRRLIVFANVFLIIVTLLLIAVIFYVRGNLHVSLPGNIRL